MLQMDSAFTVFIILNALLIVAMVVSSILSLVFGLF